MDQTNIFKNSADCTYGRPRDGAAVKTFVRSSISLASIRVSSNLFSDGFLVHVAAPVGLVARGHGASARARGVQLQVQVR